MYNYSFNNVLNRFLLGLVVLIFTFCHFLLVPIIPFLFIIYCIILLYALIIKNSYLFVFIGLLTVPFTRLFSFNDIVYSQSIYLLFSVFGIIRYKVYKNKYFIETLLILSFIILISFGKVDISDFISGLSLISLIYLIPLFTKMKLGSKSIISFAYIPLIFISISIYQLLYHPEVGFNLNRLGGYVFQANSFGLILNINMMIIFAKYLVNKKNYDLVIFIIYFILLLLTESRSGIITFTVGIMIVSNLYITKFKYNVKNSIVIGIFLVVLILLTNTSFFNESRYSEISLQDLETHRIYIWRDVFRLLKGKYVFGLGLGGYDQIIEEVKYQRSTHNYYISLFANIGLAGLTTVLYYMFKIFRICYLNIKNSYNNFDNNDKILGISAISSTILLLIAAFINSSAFSPRVALIYFIILGYIYKIKNKYSIKLSGKFNKNISG